MRYWIMEDQVRATEVKIHAESCHYVKHHLEHPNTKTTMWHRVNDLRQARTMALTFL